MDHGHLPILRGNRPCAVLVFRQLLAVEIHTAPLGYKAAGTVDTFFMGDSQRPLNLYEKKL